MTKLDQIKNKLAEYNISPEDTNCILNLIKEHSIEINKGISVYDVNYYNKYLSPEESISILNDFYEDMDWSYHLNDLRVLVRDKVKQHHIKLAIEDLLEQFREESIGEEVYDLIYKPYISVDNLVQDVYFSYCPDIEDCLYNQMISYLEVDSDIDFYDIDLKELLSKYLPHIKDTKTLCTFLRSQNKELTDETIIAINEYCINGLDGYDYVIGSYDPSDRPVRFLDEEYDD